MARVFEVLENPEPGWKLRKIEQHIVLGETPEWHVELVRQSDGACATFHHEDLYVAWARATERAHMESNGLMAEQPERQPVPGVYESTNHPYGDVVLGPNAG